MKLSTKRSLASWLRLVDVPHNRGEGVNQFLKFYVTEKNCFCQVFILIRPLRPVRKNFVTEGMPLFKAS